MKADTSGNGKISIEDYMDICDEYGISVSEEELKNVAVCKTYFVNIYTETFFCIAILRGLNTSILVIQI